MRRAVAVVALAVAASVPLGGAAHAGQQPTPKPTGSLTVSAAASLTDVFTEMGRAFERRHPGTTVRFNFGSSSTLAQQIDGGAPVDVFASADGFNMQKVVAAGYVKGTPVDFASNALTIVVKPGNPERVRSLGDLAELPVVALCGPTVPCGRYAAQALEQAGVAIATDRITYGADVKATLGAVANGDADAAIVYVTDAQAARKTVDRVRIPASLNILAVYPMARLDGSTNPRLAKAWVRFVVSRAGQGLLADFGFHPAPEVA